MQSGVKVCCTGLHSYESQFVTLLKAAIILIINHSKWGASRSWTSHSIGVIIGAISWSDLQLVLWIGLMMRTASPSELKLPNSICPLRLLLPQPSAQIVSPGRSLSIQLFTMSPWFLQIAARRHDSGILPCCVKIDFAAVWFWHGALPCRNWFWGGKVA